LQVPLLALSVAGGLAWIAMGGGWMAALAAAAWIGPIRLLWALHAQCAVNSVCHLGPQSEHGSGLNLLWLSPVHLFQGENWHANHHRCPLDARLGQRWWQFDLGWTCIRMLGLLGLASGIRTPGDHSGAADPGVQHGPT
jgi:stearoyl-CoA desaturase (delta-9 desaturase)